MKYSSVYCKKRIPCVSFSSILETLQRLIYMRWLLHFYIFIQIAGLDFLKPCVITKNVKLRNLRHKDQHATELDRPHWTLIYSLSTRWFLTLSISLKPESPIHNHYENWEYPWTDIAKRATISKYSFNRIVWHSKANASSNTRLKNKPALNQNLIKI